MSFVFGNQRANCIQTLLGGKKEATNARVQVFVVGKDALLDDRVVVVHIGFDHFDLDDSALLDAHFRPAIGWGLIKVMANFSVVG